MIKSRPVEWYLLICELEQLKETIGLGSAVAWFYVHREDYERAKQCVDETKEFLAEWTTQ